MQYSSLVYVSFIAGNNYHINADFVNGLNLFACKRNGNNICIKNLLTNKVVTGTCGDWVENAGLYYLWKNATYASFARAAIAGQTICNGYFSTDEDDEKVLNWYKKQYPWLFPDQAWTVVGKPTRTKIVLLLPTLRAMVMILYCRILGLQKGVATMKKGICWLSGY